MNTKLDIFAKVLAEVNKRADNLTTKVIHTSKHAGGHTKPRNYRESKRSRRKAQRRARRSQ